MSVASRLAIDGERSVHRLGLGTMSLTGRGVWGAPEHPDEARSVLRRAVDAGVELVDTADSYGPGTAESLVAEALYPYAGIVIATKGGLTRQGPGRWAKDCRPAALRRACHGSLRRLRVETIDLYYLHAVDPGVPFEESVGVLAELRSEGKIREIGVSNVSAAELRRARAVVPVAAVQNRFGLADRSSLDVLRVCEEHKIPFVAWAPLAKGGLTRPHAALGAIADKYGATPAQVALAWVIGCSPVTIPIPGTSSLRHLEENLASASLSLELSDIDELSRHSFAHAMRRPLARRVRRRAQALVRRPA